MRRIILNPMIELTTASDDRWLPFVIAVTCGTALIAGLAQSIGALL